MPCAFKSLLSDLHCLKCGDVSTVLLCHMRDGLPIPRHFVPMCCLIFDMAVVTGPKRLKSISFIGAEIAAMMSLHQD